MDTINFTAQLCALQWKSLEIDRQAAPQERPSLPEKIAVDSDVPLSLKSGETRMRTIRRERATPLLRGANPLPASRPGLHELPNRSTPAGQSRHESDELKQRRILARVQPASCACESRGPSCGEPLSD